MFNIFAQSFLTATRQDAARPAPEVANRANRIQPDHRAAKPRMKLREKQGPANHPPKRNP
jgi:hypothetical protein